MSLFDFDSVSSRYFRPEQIAKLKSVRVGIAGAGGLGSNCAHFLVRTGVEHFVVADFDRIEPSNLNRQFYFADQVGLPKVQCLRENLLKINPRLDIDTHELRLDGSLLARIFGDCDIVVEAFDRAETKALLAQQFASTDKFIVSGSGMVGIGDSDQIVVRKIRSNFYLIGDGVSDSADTPPYAPRVAVAAAKMADTVVAHILNR